MKNIFKNKIVDYTSHLACSPSKRFIALFIDFILMCVVTLLLYLGSYEILINNSSYINKDNTINEEVEHYNNLINETHLVEFEDDTLKERKSIDETVLTLVLKQINLSYTLDDSGNFNNHEPVQIEKYGIANKETDNIAYFYLNYLPSHNENNDIVDINNLTYEEFYKVHFEELAGSLYSELFTTKDDEIIYITPYVASRIYRYIYEDYSGGEDYYYNVINIYRYIFEESEKLVINSKNYYSNHYVIYEDAIIKQANMVNLSFVLTILVSFTLIIAIPQIFLKDGKTIGKSWQGIALISKKGKALPIGLLILRNVFSFLGYLLVSIMIPMLPMFNFSYNSFQVPLFYLGSLNISYGFILILIGIIAIISSIPSLFTKNKNSLIDYISMTNVIELKS